MQGRGTVLTLVYPCNVRLYKGHGTVLTLSSVMQSAIRLWDWASTVVKQYLFWTPTLVFPTLKETYGWPFPAKCGLTKCLRMLIICLNCPKLRDYQRSGRNTALTILIDTPLPAGAIMRIRPVGMCSLLLFPHSVYLILRRDICVLLWWLRLAIVTG
jgi:hypothetical protein